MSGEEEGSNSRGGRIRGEENEGREGSRRMLGRGEVRESGIILSQMRNNLFGVCIIVYVLGIHAGSDSEIFVNLNYRIC